MARTTISEVLSASPECEGPEKCWYNSETGYTEFCEKHDGMLLEADYAMREKQADYAPPSELLTPEPWEENGYWHLTYADGITGVYHSQEAMQGRAE